VADFNGDGNLDLALGNSAVTISLLLGNGDGTFTPASTLPPSSAGASGLLVADLNHDGKLDLVAVNFLTYNTISVFLGDGTGAFTPVVNPTTIPLTNSFALADFNGDGNLDLVTSSGTGGTVSIMLGNGDGTFAPPTTTQFFGPPMGTIAIADFNGDGYPDVVTATQSQALPGTPLDSSTAFGGSAYTPGFAYLQGNGNGTFQTPVITMGTGSIPPIAADFDGDGRADLVGYNPTTPDNPATTVSIYLARHSTTATVVVPNISLVGLRDHILQATYAGDGNFSADQSSPSSGTGTTGQTVATTLLLPSHRGPQSPSGQPVVLTATLSPYSAQNLTTNGEIISFGSLGTGILSNGVATLSTSSLPVANNYAFTANYPGDSNFAPSTSPSVPYHVYVAVPTVTWNPPSVLLYTGQPIGSAILNATSPTPGFFEYTETPGGGVAVGIGASTILPAGSYTLTATLTPTNLNYYTFGQANAPLVVTPAPLTLSPVNATRVYGQPNPPFSPTVSGSLNGDYVTATGSTPATITSPAGTYPITYTVAGINIANYTASPTTGTLTITRDTPTITWTPAPLTYGTPLSAAQLNASASTPGTFTYSPAAGASLPAGPTTLTATFTPSDATDYTTAPASASLTVGKPTLSLTVTNAARVFGAANPTFTGAIAGAVNGDTFTESFATAATASSIVGTYAIVPSATGTNLADYNVAPSNGALTVTQAGTATTFALSNANLTLTAHVASLTTGTPTGTVAFYEGQTQVGSATLSGGAATYTATSFPVGDVVVTAQYSGDTNFTQSTSPATLVFSLLPLTTTLTAPAAGSVTDTLNLTVAPGYSGTLQFACTGLPQYATCSFQPSTLTFTGTANTASVALTIQTGTTATLTTPPALSNRRTPSLAALLGLPTLLALCLATRKRRFHGILMLLTLSILGLSITACGGSPSNTTTGTTTQTPPGTTTVNVVNTGTGGLTQTTSLSLTVQ
jgi:hypothetical protein